MKILTDDNELIGTPETTPLYKPLLQSHRIKMKDVLLHPPKTIVEGVIQEGTLAVIAGESGTGKTWVIMDMAVAIATGQDWLGKSVNKSRVGFFDEEMGEWGWYSRLDMIQHGRHLQDNPDWDVMVSNFSGIDLLQTDGQLQLEYHITSNGLNVAFIDSLSGIHLGNENDTKDMTVVMNGLLHVAKRTNCAIVTLHHVKKSDGDYRGSGLIRNKVDNLFMLEEENEGEKSFKLWSKKMRYAQDVKLFGRHVWDNGSYSLNPLEKEEVAETTKAPTKYDLAKSAIESALSHGDKGCTHTELKNYILSVHPNVTVSTATYCISQMKKNGELKQDKNGLYTLSDGEVSYGKESKWQVVGAKK